MKFRALIFAVVLVAPVGVFAATNDFARTLRTGMQGEDVRTLQVLLNSDPDTRIATSGVGAPGSETDYFGLATKRALIKFQEKYRAEVLAPVGLTAGTGVFGEKTRAKATLLRVLRPAASAPTTSLAKSDVYVMFPSRYSGKPGVTITLSGVGFTNTDNTIYFGPDHAVVKASSWNGQAIMFKVPNIPKGNYHIWVKNAHGESNRDAFFVVTDGVTPEPVIESVSPEQGGRGTKVTLTGSGFTTKGNMVRTGTNILEGVVSSDGHTLSFTLPSNFLVASTTSSSMKTVSVPIWIFVVNENGISNGKTFTLSL